MAEQLFFSLKSPVAVTPDTMRGAVPEFVKTTLFVPLAVFKSWFSNEIGAVGRVGTGASATPVPDNEKVKGLFSAPEVTVSVPVLVPGAVGEKTMFKVHDDPSARDDPQLLSDAIWKSPEMLD
jgi:hypothetical protein